jgi:biotin/methionine sulfoxide reductase
MSQHGQEHMRSSPLQTHWGPVVVTTDGPDSIQIEPHIIDPDPAPFIQSMRQATHSRVARPAIRKSWLDNGPGSHPERRGKEPFIEVSWDTAFDHAASELARVRDTYGHASIFGGSYGWGSAGRFHLPAAQVARFMRLFGGCTDVWGTYSSTATEAIIPYVLGMPYFIAQARLTSWSSIASNTELFVCFGGLRVTNAMVSYTGQGPHGTRAWMKRAHSRGITFLNVSPLRDDINAEFSPRWLAPRPGTDVALMAALIHTLVADITHDVDFLNRYCAGWPTLEAYLTGSSDGITKDANWAASITGLEAATIRALAREMREKRTLINVTYSMQRQDHGEQPYWMAIALAAALGQIGLPGGGFAFYFGSAGNPGRGTASTRIPGLPVPKRPQGLPIISVSRVSELLEAQAGEPFEANGVSDQYPDTRLVYWCGGNVFHHHQDLNRLLRAWERPETIIVHEPFWTPMAKRADIVLPATTPLERSDLGNAETHLLATTPVLDAFGEARDDYAIFAGLANRLGFGETFTEGRSADEWIEHLYAKFRGDSNETPDFATFQRTGTLAHDGPKMGESLQDFLADFRSDPDGCPLGTPSGRIELYSQTIAGYGYDDCPGHPTWLEPYERLGSEMSATYPLHLTSNQPASRLHSQYDHGEASLATKTDGREPCRLHPDDALARGITNGTVVKLFNDRGACLAVAEVTDMVMPGVVQLSTGAWYDPDESGLCKAGNPNVLTRDKGTSMLSQGPTAHTCLIQIEPYAGKAPKVTAHHLPELIHQQSSN